MIFEHEIVFGDLELVRIDGERVYIVDRERKRLRSLDRAHPAFKLTQVQCGRRSDGSLEVLERYALKDESESIVLDASPVFLESLSGRAG